MNEAVAKLLGYFAFACAVFACGFGSGVAYSQRGYNAALLKLNEKVTDQSEKTVEIVTKYITKVETREVPVYVENTDDCDHASGSFRLFFNASATDSRVPEAAEGINAAPVPFADLAGTIASGHNVCHDTADQLRALQAWAKEVTK